MTTITIGRWLLVTIAVLGLAVAAPVVSAHGSGPAADDAPPSNGTADEWAVWMTDHMADGHHIDDHADDHWDDHMDDDHVDDHWDDHMDDDHVDDDHRGYGHGYGC